MVTGLHRLSRLRRSFVSLRVICSVVSYQRVSCAAPELTPAVLSFQLKLVGAVLGVMTV